MVSISFKYRQEKDKDIIRERYFSTRTQMFFFSLCVVPVDLPICVAETALNESLNRVQPCSQGSLLLVEGENPGNMVEQGIYFYYWLDVLRTKALEQCRVNFTRPRSLHLPYQRGTNAF